MRRILFKNAKRIVVKAGTSNLTDENSKLDSARVKRLVDDLMELKNLGKEIILVSSGAIGAGVGRLLLSKRPEAMNHLQAVAAVGQGILMQTYEYYFEERNQPIAQILLTKDDFINSDRFKNLRSTLETLISWGVIPVINENDTVAIEEIRVGDNDTLAAQVAIGINAELLILLTDVDGLHTKNPNEHKDGKLVKVVEEVTQEIESWASKEGKGFGGMFTKIQAAKVLAKNGIYTVIVNGLKENMLRRVFEGEDVGTFFLPERSD
jgi:glutamate 5-kinase